ncbi:MAG: AAA family ATPase [Paludibacteraceae bacterium]|nr:AAA family ATPase [Paludibacteraceae bacterium]
MQLSVKNVGCIKEGNISFNGLTVIAGENGTGKSTLSKMIFSIIKAVSNISQVTNDSRRQLLEKYAMTFYRRINVRERFLVIADIDELIPVSYRAFYYKIWNLQSGSRLQDYLSKVKEHILNREDLSPRTKKLAVKDLECIHELMFNENKSSQLWSEIRYFVESEFMNQITTNGADNSHVEFIWDEANGDGVVFDVRNENMKMVKCSVENTLFDATYVETPLYLPIVDPLRRSATYIENMRSRMIQPMVPLHVKDIVNKYDLLSNYPQDKSTTDLLKMIMKIINGKFIYDEKEKTILFKDNKRDEEYMTINVASGVKTFGVLQILLQINAINENKPLLWDEPENHLHPAWQIKFAEMLVLLSKSGIPIVVSTHSPYFIQSIRYYSQKYQLASYVNYYMNEIGDDGLVTVKEVTNDLGKVFARLSAPLTEVLNLSNIE